MRWTALPQEVAKEAFRLASHKLSIATKLVVRGEFGQGS